MLSYSRLLFRGILNTVNCKQVDSNNTVLSHRVYSRIKQIVAKKTLPFFKNRGNFKQEGHDGPGSLTSVNFPTK